LDFSGYDAIIDKIAQDLHDGKMKPSDLNQELITKTYADLSEGVGKGFGETWLKNKSDGSSTLVTEMKKNLYTFASAKNYAQLETLNKMLYYQDGGLRPFNEYSQLAKGINRQYNKNWLQAEYQTARTAGQMAKKWQRIQDDKDLFPNLKYRTVGDDLVRDEHAVLNGIIRPVDDAFWGTHYPPNGWRCRCDVVQTAEDVTSTKVAIEPNPDFVGNVGKDEEIFSKNNKFFKLLKTDDNALKNAELAKLNAPYQLAYKSKSNKNVSASIYYDKTDFTANLESAKIISDELNVNIGIRPHINIEKYKNPEFTIKGKVGDLAVRDTDNLKSYINNTFSSKLGKKGQLRDLDQCFLVFNFKNTAFNTTQISDTSRQLWAKLSSYKTVKEVYLINGEKVIKIEQDALKKGYEDFKTKIETLKSNKSKA
jgi:SPP1 gp7 family putative phage head morphogenesis protein